MTPSDKSDKSDKVGTETPYEEAPPQFSTLGGLVQGAPKRRREARKRGEAMAELISRLHAQVEKLERLLDKIIAKGGTDESA